MEKDYEGSTMAAMFAAEKQKNQSVDDESNHATMQPVKQPSNRPAKKRSNGDEMLESIRYAVKQVGKETTSYRLHETEKESLDDILYGLKKRGIRSSENEIMRIAINYIITDYADNGDTSVLAGVLERLNS